jgi:hypothetical protein
MQTERPSVRAGDSILAGIKALGAPPFRTLWALSLFLSLVSNSVTESSDDAALWGSLVLLVISTYVQIATTLAAGRSQPEPRADSWIRGAFARRCFWRFVATGLISVLLVAVGLFALIIGGFVMGGVVGLAQPAVVLERCRPTDAIRRSAKLSAGARSQIAIIFGVTILAPLIATQSVYQLGWDRALGAGWLVTTFVAVSLALAGTIALTHAYVRLGGSPTPSFDDL